MCYFSWNPLFVRYVVSQPLYFFPVYQTFYFVSRPPVDTQMDGIHCILSLSSIITRVGHLNPLRLRRNGKRVADDICKNILWIESFQFLLKFVLADWINSWTELSQVMEPGNKYYLNQWSVDSLTPVAAFTNMV